VDLEKGLVISSFVLPELVASLSDQPWGPDVAISGGLALISNNQEVGQVFVASTSDGTISSSITVGGRPQSILRQGGQIDLYAVSKANNGSITVINGISGTKSSTVEISDPPTGLRAVGRVTRGSRDLLVIVYEQALVLYDTEYEIEVGRVVLDVAAAARAVSVGVNDNGAILIGTERGTFGDRLIYLSF
jgi:hypothetical protein